MPLLNQPTHVETEPRRWLDVIVEPAIRGFLQQPG